MRASALGYEYTLLALEVRSVEGSVFTTGLILIAQLDLSMVDSKSCAKDGIATKHVRRIGERDSRIEILRVRKVKCGPHAAVAPTAG